jgi:hypothetical protein
MCLAGECFGDRSVLSFAARRVGRNGAGTLGLASRRLSELEEEEIRRELAQLRQEHRDLDLAIAAMIDSPKTIDTIRIQRLKKRKLVLKDRIATLEDRLLPDIIA